nr:phage tail tape measure protein [uncultured Dysosmobacter sp.]
MASEVYRIEIPVRVEDQTEPGASTATKKINSFDRSIQQTQERLDKMNRTKYQVALETIDKVSSVVGRIGTSLKGLVGKAWRVTMGVVDKATAPLRGIINILKNPLLQMGAVLGISVGLKDTIDTYSTFEATMSKVQAVSGATADQMELLNAKAKEMGATTKFTASEAGDAFTYMAMAGWKSEQMLEGIDGIMALSAADGLDLATTSDIVTDALTAFGLTAKDSGHFADVLAKASSSANTNVSMLGESFKYVAPIAGAMKYSVEDVSIALGLMANASVKGSMAGTSLKTALANLSAPTDQMAAVMDKYGISLTDSQGNMRSLKDVIDTLRKTMGKLSETEKTAAASTLFGKEAMSGMLAIINASDEDYQKLVESINNADGAAQEMADTMLDNLAGSMTLLQSAAEGVKLTIGQRLSPYLRQFVTWLTGKMPDIEKAAGSVFDFIDEKVAWLKSTIDDFTSSDEWASADVWGKIGIAWDKIVAEPFSEWWEGTGKQWLTDKVSGFGETLGAGISKGLLFLLGIDTGGALEDGKDIGASFIEGFKNGFDTEAVTDALTDWAQDHKGLIAAAGVIAGGKLLGGIGKGIQQGRSLINDIKSILGKGSGAGGAAAAATGGGYTTTMNVRASVVNIIGGAGGNATTGAAQAVRTAAGALGGTSTPLALGGATSAPLALPGATATAGGLTSATGWLGRLLQLGSSSSVVGADGTLLAVNGGLGGTLGSVAGALGSGATTAAGAAAVGAGSIAGGIGGILGIGSGLLDIFRGTKKTGKEAKDDYFSGGTKLGMVGAGAGAGAAIGAAFGGVGAIPGALIGAGIGGIGALFGGRDIGEMLSDATDEGGWLSNMGGAISNFFTDTLPTKWGEFWDGVGDFFTETVPYALGFAAGKVTSFFTETLPAKWGEFWDGVTNFFTETIPTWWENVKTGTIDFFTVTLPAKWTEFWGGIETFFTETIPAWWEDIKTGTVTFFTETLPTKWTEFWKGIETFFTETIPAWVEGAAASAKTFFTETIPQKLSDFFGGIGEKISGFFGGVWSNIKGAFGAGYADATAHAWGGIMTKPHLGLVAEDGAESIIPLSPSKRGRGLDLWEQTGAALGVRPYADGGIVGDTEDEPITLTPAGGGGYPPIQITLQMTPQFVIQAREEGLDEDSIVAVIKAHIKEMVDDISDELAERLARIFANMPVKGGA